MFFANKNNRWPWIIQISVNDKSAVCVCRFLYLVFFVFIEIISFIDEDVKPCESIEDI